MWGCNPVAPGRVKSHWLCLPSHSSACLSFHLWQLHSSMRSLHVDSRRLQNSCRMFLVLAADRMWSDAESEPQKRMKCCRSCFFFVFFYPRLYFAVGGACNGRRLSPLIKTRMTFVGWFSHGCVHLSGIILSQSACCFFLLGQLLVDFLIFTVK